MTPVQFLPLLCAVLVCTQTYSLAPLLRKFDRSALAASTTADHGFVASHRRKAIKEPVLRTFERPAPVAALEPSDDGTASDAAASPNVTASGAAASLNVTASDSAASPNVTASGAAASPNVTVSVVPATLVSGEPSFGIMQVILALSEDASADAMASLFAPPDRFRTPGFGPEAPVSVFAGTADDPDSAPYWSPSFDTPGHTDQGSGPQTSGGTGAATPEDLPAVPLPTSAVQLLAALVLGLAVASRRRGDRKSASRPA